MPADFLYPALLGVSVLALGASLYSGRIKDSLTETQAARMDLLAQAAKQAEAREAEWKGLNASLTHTLRRANELNRVLLEREQLFLALTNVPGDVHKSCFTCEHRVAHQDCAYAKSCHAHDHWEVHIPSPTTITG